jgi:hypothetical protein
MHFASKINLRPTKHLKKFESTPIVVLNVVQRCNMATNLTINDKLIIKAESVGGKKIKKAAETEALEEYIQRRKQLQLTSLFGKIDYDPEYDYKRTRTRE